MKTTTLSFGFRSWVIILGLTFLAGCSNDDPGIAPTNSDSSFSLEKGGPPSTPPANPVIVFSGLGVINEDGSNLTDLSIGGTQPSWSPDGRSIVYYYYPSGGPRGVYVADISVVNGVPRASNARFLAEGMRPEWSPLGDRIAYVDFIETQILAIPPTGGTPTALYTVLYDTSLITSPTWRGDGSQIAFVEYTFLPAGVSRYIRVLELGTGAVRTAVATGNNNVFFPEWARGSDKLAYEVSVGGVVKIYTINLTSGSPVYIVDGRSPSWSPDDSKLVYIGAHGINTITVSTGATQLISRKGGDYLAWKR